MRLRDAGRWRLVAAVIVSAFLLVGLGGCGGEEERRGTQIEWRPGTPPPTGAPAPPAG